MAIYADGGQNRKKPANRSKFDKEVLKADEKLNICYMVYSGDIFKMIPKIGDPTYKWYSPRGAISLFSTRKRVRMLEV